MNLQSRMNVGADDPADDEDGHVQRDERVVLGGGGGFLALCGLGLEHRRGLIRLELGLKPLGLELGLELLGFELLGFELLEFWFGRPHLCSAAAKVALVWGAGGGRGKGRRRDDGGGCRREPGCGARCIRFFPSLQFSFIFFCLFL